MAPPQDVWQLHDPCGVRITQHAWPRMQVRLPKEEVDGAGDLRYAWRALRKRALDAAAELARLQVPPHHHLVLRTEGGPHTQACMALMCASWLQV